MNSSNIKAIIFDMDGVMFDTERLYEEAFTEVAKNWGYEAEVTTEFIKSFKGKKKEAIKKLYKELLDGIAVKRTGKEFDADEHIKQVLQYLDNYINNNGMPIKDGLLDLLQYAKNNNIKLAIGTSEKFERVKFYLDRANISEDIFDAIVCGDMVENGKPAPDIYLKACSEVDVNPINAIVCEDATNGIVAAYRSGAKPVMIIDLIEPTDEIRKMLYVEPLESLSQVQAIIEELKYKN